MRFISKFLVWIILIVSFNAHAEIKATLGGFVPHGPNGLPFNASFDSVEAACRALVGDWVLEYTEYTGVQDNGTTLFVCLGTYPNNSQGYSTYNSIAATTASCPANSQNSTPNYSEAVGRYCFCDEGLVDLGEGQCVVPPPPEPENSNNMCEAPAGTAVGNPIIPATGDKYEKIADYTDNGIGPIDFIRNYRSNRGLNGEDSTMGKGWKHNHEWNISAIKNINGPLAANVTITSPEGYQTKFYRSSPGRYGWSSPVSRDILIGDAGQSWTYRRQNDSLEIGFNSTTQLEKVLSKDSSGLYYSYGSNGQINSITNKYGKSLTIQYNADGKISKILLPANREINYRYDSYGRLISVIYPDTTSKSYLYEDARFVNALTGVVDESGVRYSSFAYDEKGRAISTSLAGGFQNNTVIYKNNSTATVTDALGTSRNYTFGNNGNKSAATSAEFPSSSLERDYASIQQDGSGRTIKKVDFKGNVTNLNWDTRGLLFKITEGAGTINEQITEITWDQYSPVPIKVTQGNKSVTYEWLNTLLYKRTEVDKTNNSIQTRTWQWDRDEYQNISQIIYPNGSIDRITRDSRGNVLTLTNGMGHLTRFEYDDADRLIKQMQPNGSSIQLTWDVRDRLVSKTLNGTETTRYYYNPTGLLRKIEFPNGLSNEYFYNSAHQLTAWTNNRWAKGSYVLDMMGNKLKESIQNTDGSYAKKISRTVNSINRVSRESEGDYVYFNYEYDQNGDLKKSKNALDGFESYELDSLSRISSITRANNSTASISYDLQGTPSIIRDFKGELTEYKNTAFGESVVESGKQIGVLKTIRNNSGLPVEIVDALGQATNIEYDLLDRPTSVRYADGHTTTLRYDLQGSSFNASGSPNASIGSLSEVNDRAGLTTYQRDIVGRVIKKSVLYRSGLSGVIEYKYNSKGQLASMTYPGQGGQELTYIYDASGQIESLYWNQSPLVKNIAWNSLGQPLSWTWAFGETSGIEGVNLPASRTYDASGRTTGVKFGIFDYASFEYDQVGRVKNIQQILINPKQPSDPSQEYTSSMGYWSANYDSAGRVVNLASSINGIGENSTYGYDTNDNLASVAVTGSSSSEKTYLFDGNLQIGFTLNGSGTATSVTYKYDAAGNLISDGLNNFTYDAGGRIVSSTLGASDASPTVRYSHNAFGQRVFKTERQYPPAEGDENDYGFMDSLLRFFRRLWSPTASQVDIYGFAYVHDEHGNLIGEYGTGGAQSAESRQYVWLPTADGPMPIATFAFGTRLAILTDHQLTPRAYFNMSGALLWQWKFSAFGANHPNTVVNQFRDSAPVFGEPAFNLRYPGQYYDSESNLFYNHFRSYRPADGAYVQNDPMGLAAGFNRRSYAAASPLNFIDRHGLFLPALAIPALGSIGIPLADVGIGAGLAAAGLGLEYVFAKPPRDAYDIDGAKAPGKPGEAEGFVDPKRGEEWVEAPRPKGGKGRKRYGWKHEDGSVWCPSGPDSKSTGDAHGGAHWDVQTPDGYKNIYPGGKVR